MDRPTTLKGRRTASRPAGPGDARAVSALPSYPELALRDPWLPTPRVERAAQDRIGRELRAMYAELERQPIPPRLLDLMGKLAQPKD